MKPQCLALSLIMAMFVISACSQGDNKDITELSQSDSIEPTTVEVTMGARSVAESLKAYRDGQLEPRELLITYSDIHPLHGGLEMTVDGQGHVQQQALREEVQEPEDLSQAEMMLLVELIIELEAWKQTVPEREPVPDESRAVLLIQAGDSESHMWEWYNDMVGNDRLIQIREMMKQLAWE